MAAIIRFFSVKSCAFRQAGQVVGGREVAGRWLALGRRPWPWVWGSIIECAFRCCAFLGPADLLCGFPRPQPVRLFAGVFSVALERHSERPIC